MRKISKEGYKKQQVVASSVQATITIDNDNTKLDDMVFASLRKHRRPQHPA